MVKCCQNMKFEEMGSYWTFIWKKDVFWSLWGIFKNYTKQNVIMAVLRKVNAHSVVICKLIKKIHNVKEDPKEKNWFELWLFPSYLVFIGSNKKEYYVVHNSFYTKRGWSRWVVQTDFLKNGGPIPLFVAWSLFPLYHDFKPSASLLCEVPKI